MAATLLAQALELLQKRGVKSFVQQVHGAPMCTS